MTDSLSAVAFYLSCNTMLSHLANHQNLLLDFIFGFAMKDVTSPFIGQLVPSSGYSLLAI